MTEPDNVIAGSPLSIGTQVVVSAEVRGTAGEIQHPRGAVGVVVRPPLDNKDEYRIRFPDGFEAAFPRADLSILAEFKTGGVLSADATSGSAHGDLNRHVIYRCIVG